MTLLLIDDANGIADDDDDDDDAGLPSQSPCLLLAKAYLSASKQSKSTSLPVFP